MGPAIDTNILVYAEGHGDADRCRRANALMARLADQPLLLPVQVLGESVRVLHGRMKRPMGEVQDIVGRWQRLYGSADSTATALALAMTAVAEHQLPIWDALILAVAAEQRCTLLLSEDFQHGFAWQGVTVVNPFVEPMHPRLARLLR
jgi:predicted nucleic acid-binding protein